MASDERELPTIDVLGFTWDEAVELAREEQVIIEQELTAPPKGAGAGPLRVVRQRLRDGKLLCTCAAEDWGKS